MVDLSRRMQRIMHDQADFIPGFKVPGYRIAHWSWVRFPAGFDVKSSEDPSSFGLLWIDGAARAKDLADYKAGGRRGPPRTEIHDRWRGD